MGKGRAGSRKVRVYVFREWLMQTYGSYLLREGALGEDGDSDGDCKNDAGCYSEENFSVLNSSDDGDASRTTRKRKQGPSSKSPAAVVLDVAGGKGDLSWLLKNVDGLESIVVDPWKPDPNTVSRNERMVKSIEYLRKHPEEAQKRSIPCLPTFQPLAGLLPRLLEGRKKRLQTRNQQTKDFPYKLNNKSSISPVSKPNPDSNSGFEDPIPSDHQDPCRPEDFLTPQILHVPLDEAMVQRVRNQIRNHRAKKSKPETNAVETIDSPEDSDRNRQRTETCTHDEQESLFDLLVSGRIKLVVGFHPDQATEACIDLARILGVPYCVVPCCVFPSEFPNRRVRQAQPCNRESNPQAMVPVRTYHQFLEYLRAKAAVPLPGSSCTPGDCDRRNKLHTSYLDFPFTETAKNIVLYTLPPLQSTSDSSN